MVRRSAVVCLLLGSSLAVAGEIESAFHGIEVGQTMAEVGDRLQDHASSRRIETAPARLPIAQESQARILVDELVLKDGSVIEEVAFVFGDDALSMIEAHGGATDAMSSLVASEGTEYGPWVAHVAERIVMNRDEDRAWVLSDDALHPHLFLNGATGFDGEEVIDPSAARPAAFRFGTRYEELEDELLALAPLHQLRTEDQPWLPTQPAEQTQLNLFGVEFAGAARKAEVVFGDGKLELVWILTGAAEEERVREALVAEYGEPVFVNEVFEAFEDWTVALRKDKPEVLMVADHLAPVFRDQFGGN